MGTFECECCTTGCEIGSDTFSRTADTATAWTAPGTVVNYGSDGVSWNDLANVAADDGSYASVYLDATNWYAKPLDCSNFGFAVPADAQVTGLEVRIRKFTDAGAIEDLVRVFGTDGVVLSASQSGGAWPLAEAETTYGSSTQHWLMILTPAEVNSAALTVRVVVAKTLGGAAGNCYIDRIEARIHYKAAALGADWSVQAGNWQMANLGGLTTMILPAAGAVITSDANAYLRFETAHPDSVAEHVVLLALTEGRPAPAYPPRWSDRHYYTYGDKVRAVLCDTLFAELEYGFNSFESQTPPSGCVVLRIFNGTTLLQESPPIRVENGWEDMSLWAGYSATTGLFWAAATGVLDSLPSQVRVAENVGTVTGTKVGIGTGDTVSGTVAFSNFIYFKHNNGVVVTDCYGPGVETALTCQFVFRWYCDTGTAIADVGCCWQIMSGTWDAIEIDDFSGGGFPIPAGLPDYLQTTDAYARIDYRQEQSAWNCSEYTDFGYHSAHTYVKFSTPGDTFRLYVDWDGTEGHWAEIVCGDSVGLGSMIRLGKSALTLEEFTPPIGTRPGAWTGVGLCTFAADDGSGLDVVAVNAGSGYLVSATTVYGNKRVAVGTGGTVNGLVQIAAVTGFANANACRDCAPTECDYCPGEDGSAGYAIEISGLSNPHSAPCDCPSLNATFVVPSSYRFGRDSCSGAGQWHFCTIAGFGGGQVKLFIAWNIVAGSAGHWKLQVAVQICLPWEAYGNGSFGIYSQEFSMSTRCDQLAAEVLAYEASRINSPRACDGLEALTVKATSI